MPPESVGRMTVGFSKERCPKCGASLLTNGETSWCSFVGGPGVKACDYGLESPARETGRQFHHVVAMPMAGDVVEIWGANGEGEMMLRVLCVIEDHVGYKEYGVGRYWCHIKAWQTRLRSARAGKLIRGGDVDLPF